MREVAEETGLHVRLGAPLCAPALPARQRPPEDRALLGRSRGRGRRRQRLPRQRRDRRRRLGAGGPGGRAPDLRLRPADPGGGAPRSGRRPRRWSCSGTATRCRASSGTATTGSDPLLASGTLQAQRLVPLLAAYDVTTLVTSSSLRCVDTVAAYAETTGFPLRLTAGLSEEDATKASVDEVVEDLLDAGERQRAVHPPAGAAAGVGGARSGEAPARPGRDAGGPPPQGPCSWPSSGTVPDPRGPASPTVPFM